MEPTFTLRFGFPTKNNRKDDGEKQPKPREAAEGVDPQQKTAVGVGGSLLTSSRTRDPDPPDYFPTVSVQTLPRFLFGKADERAKVCSHY